MENHNNQHQCCNATNAGQLVLGIIIVLCTALITITLMAGFSAGAGAGAGDDGYNRGFNACIEENNLYWRYQ